VFASASRIGYGGQVFEDNKPTTLVEAMAALKQGLAEWFDENTA